MNPSFAVQVSCPGPAGGVQGRRGVLQQPPGPAHLPRPAPRAAGPPAAGPAAPPTRPAGPRGEGPSGGALREKAGDQSGQDPLQPAHAEAWGISCQTGLH